MSEPADSRFPDEALERVRAFCAEPRSTAEIAAHLGVDESDQLDDWLEALARLGRLQRHKGRRYQAVNMRAAVGLYRRSRGEGRSGGLVAPRDGGLGIIDIPPGMEEGAQDGDLVLASYRESRDGGRDREGRKRLQGRVLNIIESRPAEAVGVLEYTRFDHPRVRLEGQNLPRYAYLQGHELHGAREGSVIRVRLQRKPDSAGRSRAEFIGTVGNIDNPMHDLDNLIALFGFPGEFSDEALEQARALPKDPGEAEFTGRVDLRQTNVITIDPKDAEDHDDAISLEELPGGLTRLGVHIADVAHYVTPGSPLDEDARFRATSVYLPSRLIPMLPKELSAGLCSLHDKVDRLALSCFMVFDAQGEMLRREIVKSVIRVRRYLTYEEVLPVLEGKGKTGDDAVDELLVTSRKLADLLLARRMARGALVLEIPRPHVIVDKAGRVTSVEPEHHDIAHNLIEEFMLICNEAVARFLIERGLPYIGRIHPEPGEDAIEEFAEFCDALKIHKPDWETPGGVQKFLDSLRKRPGYEAIHYALLRSMARAIYHAGPELHYALATDRYVHFTSPIRRYPDTLTHQVCTEYLGIGGEFRWEERALNMPWADGSKGAPRGKVKAKRIPDFERWEFAMPQIASHCTDRNIKADRGELAATQIKILRMLLPRVGDAFHGTVVSISNNGVIVRLDESMAEGYIEFRELTEGWAEMHKFWVDFESDGVQRKAMLGDRMEVEIVDIDLGSRSMRLTPLGRFAARGVSRRRGRERGIQGDRNGRRRKGRRRR